MTTNYDQRHNGRWYYVILLVIMVRISILFVELQDSTRHLLSDDEQILDGKNNPATQQQMEDDHSNQNHQSEDDNGVVVVDAEFRVLEISKLKAEAYKIKVEAEIAKLEVELERLELAKAKLEADNFKALAARAHETVAGIEAEDTANIRKESERELDYANQEGNSNDKESNKGKGSADGQDLEKTKEDTSNLQQHLPFRKERNKKSESSHKEDNANKAKKAEQPATIVAGTAQKMNRKHEGICSPWEINIDDFWQDHPDWEISYENETHTCFAPMKDPEKAEFHRRLHKQQFPSDPKGGACDNVAVSWWGGYGIGSHYMIILPNDFLAYFYENRPFTITRSNRHEVFAYTPYWTNNTNRDSWAACPSQDMWCYFLPITNCEVEPGHPAAPSGRKRPKKKLRVMWNGKDSEEKRELLKQHRWFSHYMMRPRQETRRRLYRYIQKEAPALPTAPHCSWMHVRRGDAQTEKDFGFHRNFYPISQYLTRGNIKPKDGDVLILTDDEAAIEEALLLHPEYQWKFFNKTRNRGVSNIMHSHFPSNDPALETIAILAEMKVASQCEKAVFGESKFPLLIEAAMAEKHRKEDIKRHKIDARDRHKHKDASIFMKDLEAKLERARNATSKVR